MKKSNFSYLGPVLDRVLWKREEVCQDRIPEVSSPDSDKFHWDFHFQKQWRRNLLSHEAEQASLNSFWQPRRKKNRLKRSRKKADKKHFCDLDLLLELGSGRPPCSSFLSNGLQGCRLAQPGCSGTSHWQRHGSSHVLIKRKYVRAVSSDSGLQQPSWKRKTKS